MTTLPEIKSLLSTLTFDNIHTPEHHGDQFKETIGYGSNQGITYRTARFKAHNGDTFERDYRIRVNSDTPSSPKITGAASGQLSAHGWDQQYKAEWERIAPEVRAYFDTLGSPGDGLPFNNYWRCKFATMVEHRKPALAGGSWGNRITQWFIDKFPHLAEDTAITYEGAAAGLIADFDHWQKQQTQSDASDQSDPADHQPLPFTTVKQLRDLKSAPAVRVSTMQFCLGDEDKQRQNIIDTLLANGITQSEIDAELKDEEGTFTFRSNFWWKPKIPRTTHGIITFRPGGDYTFTAAIGPTAGKVGYGSPIKRETLQPYGFALSHLHYFVGPHTAAADQWLADKIATHRAEPTCPSAPSTPSYPSDLSDASDSTAIDQQQSEIDRLAASILALFDEVA